jgi:hypothetical protein
LDSGCAKNSTNIFQFLNVYEVLFTMTDMNRYIYYFRGTLKPGLSRPHTILQGWGTKLNYFMFPCFNTPYACKFTIKVKVTAKFASKRKHHSMKREGSAGFILTQSVCVCVCVCVCVSPGKSGDKKGHAFSKGISAILSSCHWKIL